jgi:1,4-dihydroxy-2-naphthoate octaprenyltransferase
LAIQGLAWVLLCGSALKDQLTKNEKSTMQMRLSRRNGYFAFIVYALLAILALWFPLTIAIVSMLTWIFWLIFGINMKT